MRTIHVSIVILLAITSVANATISVTIQEDGNDVLASWSGDLILGTEEAIGSNGAVVELFPTGSTLTTPGDFKSYTLASGPAFGTGVSTFFEPLGLGGGVLPEYSFSGDLFGLSNASSGANQGRVQLPNAFTSGDSISGSIRYHDVDMAGLGITQGSYSWDVVLRGAQPADDVIVDTISMNVIPEPATAGLIAICGGGILMARRFKQIKTARGTVFLRLTRHYRSSQGADPLSQPDGLPDIF